jgi:NaMN:DMB phosphoribosyltransferase
MPASAPSGGGHGADGAELPGGGAAINVFTRLHGLALEVVDVGVRAPLPASPGW